MSDVAGWLPALATLRDYKLGWLRHDLMAGLVLTTMLVPVGIAYAVASGLPGVNGLYATIVPLLAYALFGPSRILVLGPDSSLAPVILAVVLANAGNDPMHAVALAAAMAVVSGLFCVLAGLLKLGFVTELLSKPIRYGYMNGIALTVLISQLPKFLGFSVEADGPLRSLWAIGTAIASGGINWTALAVGGATLSIILLKGKRLPGRVYRGDRRRRDRPSQPGGQGTPSRLPPGSRPSFFPGSTRADLGRSCWAVALHWCRLPTPVCFRAPMPRLGRSVDNQEMLGRGRHLPRRSWLPSQQPRALREASARSNQLTGVVGAGSGCTTGRRSRPSKASADAGTAVVIASAIGRAEGRTCAIWRIAGVWPSILASVGVACRAPHRARHRGRRHRIPVGRLAAVFAILGRAEGVPAITTSSVIGSQTDSGPGAPAGMPFVLRQCRVFAESTPAAVAAR